MKIYTKRGDGGTTGLYRQARVNKSHPLISAIGSVDELNAVVGVVRSLKPPEAHDKKLEIIQHHLFDVGAEIANRHPELLLPDPTSDKQDRSNTESDGKVESIRIGDTEIQKLEAWIDEMESSLPPLKEFVLPGGHPIAANVHLARTVCRRAEREVEQLDHVLANRSHSSCTAYLNRLSDYLFVLSRSINVELGVPDVKWSQEHKSHGS